jgi:DNA-binding winged helix-turn-helix (wHTH) protein
MQPNARSNTGRRCSCPGCRCGAGAAARPAPPRRLLLLDNGVRVDLGAATVSRPDGTEVPLSRNALVCLEALVAAGGNCVAADTLRHRYRIGDPAHTVRTLRVALGDVGDAPGRPRHIVTAGWHGYRLALDSLDPARCAYRALAPAGPSEAAARSGEPTAGRTTAAASYQPGASASRR